MKIAHVSEHASPLAAIGGVDAGGQNVHVAALSIALAQHGHEVAVYTRRDDESLPARVPLLPRVTVHHVDAGPARQVPKDALLEYMPAFADRLRAALEARHPDIVHSHFWMSGWAALEATGPLGLPLVHTFHALGVVKRRHQQAADTSPPARLGHELELTRRADRIVATCSDEVAELRRLGAEPGRLEVVPCGVDLERFTPVGAAEPRPPRRHRLVSVGRLVERKGIDDGIRALAHVPGADLVVAGGPAPADLDRDHEVGRLRRLAAGLGVADRVDFRGCIAREQVPPLLRSADAVLCVPWYEPFGIVPLEAMACGVPVVATAVGGMLDTVPDGLTGVHVPPRRPERLAAAVQRLLADPALRARLGRAGEQRARARYGWDRVATATVAVYRDVLAARSGAPASAVGQ